MKRLTVILIGLFALATVLSAASANGPYGITLGEDVTVSIKKIESMEGVFNVGEFEVQDAKLRTYAIGDSPRNPIANLGLYSVDDELVWWTIGSQNSAIAFTIARELFKGQSFETYQESAWLVADDVFIAISPDYRHEGLYIHGFSIEFAESKKNIWITGQYNALRSAYDAYLKYINN